MTVSNIQRISESFEVEGRGARIAVGSIYALAAGSPIRGEGGGGATPKEEESTLRRLELARI